MKTGKRLISLLLLAAMVFTAIPANAFAGESVSKTVGQLAAENQIEMPFTDVKKGDWYYDAIEYAYKNGIFNGTAANSFDPGGAVTRAMFVTVMGRFAGIDPTKYSGADTGFKDVAPDAYYAPYVAWAVEKGITGGVGNQRFDIDGLVTREQMAVFTHRFFEAYGVVYPSDTKTSPTDIDQVASWAREAVQALWNAGIFNGDGNGRFYPQELASRAEAATFLRNTDNKTDAKGVDSSGGGSGGGKSGNKNPPIWGDETCTVTFVTNSGTEIAPIKVSRGTALRNFPTPSKTGYLFIGWYLEDTFTTQFFEHDVVNRDLTLYANYTLLVTGENEVKAYSGVRRTAEENAVEPNYSIQISAPGKSSDFVKQNIRLDSNSDEGSLAISKSGDTGDTYDISMIGGFKAGMSYTLVLLDDALTFVDKEAQIRELSFRILKAEVDNLALNDEMKYIPLSQVRAITFNQKAIDSDASLSKAIFEFAHSLSGGEAAPAPTGTFEYGESLTEGDLVCLYSGIKPAEGTDEELAYEDISYVKVVSKVGNTVTFKTAEPTEVLKLPKTAVISKTDIELTQSPTSKTAGQTFAFTANTIIFDTMAAGENTFVEREIKNGDVIVIYDAASILHASEEGSILGTIESISGNAAPYTVTAKTTTMEKLQETVLDYYQTTPIDMEEMGERGLINLDEILDDIKNQITEDAVVEKLARSYAEMILAGDVLDEYSDGAPVGVQMADGSFASLAALGAGSSGKKVKFSFQLPDYAPKIERGKEYGQGSNQLKLQVKFTIEFKVKEAEGGEPAQTVKVQFTVDFTQELKVNINTSVDMAWGTRYLVVPYVKYCRVDADLDIKTRTEVNFKALLKTSDGYKTLEVNISDDIKKLIGLDEEDEREIVEEVALIYKRYQELVDTEMSFIRTFEKELYSMNIPIVKFVLSLELKVNVFEEISATAALYADIEFKQGTRHSFSADLIGETIRYRKSELFEDSLGFNVDLIGRFRWRAGIEASAALIVFSESLASMSLSIAGGPYFDWFGFFNYKYQRVGNVIEDSRMGAMYMEAGLFLEVGAQIKSLSKFQVNIGFVDEEWPIWSSESKNYVYDFAYGGSATQKGPETLIINKTQNSLPDYALKMIQLDLKDGKSHLTTYDASRFEIVFSNSAFSLENGKIKVNTKDILAVSDMTIIWQGGPLAFTSSPIKRTFRVIYNESGTPTPMGVLSVTVNGGLIWSERVALDTEFKAVLPSQETILERIGYANYNDDIQGNLRYTSTGSYVDSLGGKVTKSQSFEYTIPVREYSVTVTDVQNADGSTREAIIKAPYGGKFDFRPFGNTGTSIRGETYTKFRNVETVGKKGISLHTNVEKDLALQILNGTHEYQATYVDNSNTVQYVFLTRKNSIPTASEIVERNTAPVFDYLNYLKEKEYRLFGIDGDTTSPVTKDRTIFITAVPLAGYELFFDKNGGTWAAYYNPPQQYHPIEGTPLPTGKQLTKDGYALAGWYDNSDFSGNPVTTATGDLGTMFYYALWVAPEYTIRFSGAGEMEEIHTTFGESVTLPSRTDELTPFREYSAGFTGWNTKVDGTGVAYEDNAEFTIPEGVSPDGLLTLYAQYDDFKVSYAPTNPESPVPTGTMALCSAIYYNEIASGTITMQGDIETIYREIALPDGTTFSGNGFTLKAYTKKVFTIAADNTVKLENMKLNVDYYSNDLDVIINNAGNLTIENMEIRGNFDSEMLYNREGGKMVLRNSTLQKSSSDGRLLYNDGIVVLDNCLSEDSMRGQIINTNQMVLNNVNFNTNGYPTYYPGTISNIGGELYLLNTSVLHNDPHYSYGGNGSELNGAVQSTGGTLYIVNSLLGGNMKRNLKIGSAESVAYLFNSISGPMEEESLAWLSKTTNTEFFDDEKIVYAEDGWAGNVWHKWSVILDDPALKALAATVHLDYSDLDSIKIGFSYKGEFTSILNGATEETPAVDKYRGGAVRDLNNNRVGAEYLEIQQD